MTHFELFDAVGRIHSLCRTAIYLQEIILQLDPEDTDRLYALLSLQAELIDQIRDDVQAVEDELRRIVQKEQGA